MFFDGTSIIFVLADIATKFIFDVPDSYGKKNIPFLL